MMFESTNNNNFEEIENEKALFKGIRVSKYRHVYGSVARKDLCYDNINITKNAHDSNFCAANPKFLAIVTESCGGGTFIIIPIDKAGRVDAHAGRVTGHRGQIYDIKWNPFNDNVIASCSDDTTIKLWYIPDEGLLSRNMNQPIVELRSHKRRVNFIEWHPTADNILVSAGSDYLIIVWNTLTAEAVRVINCHTETIHSMSFNRDGSLLATTSKDKKLRIIDPRSGEVVNEGLCHHGTKASKVVYLGDSHRLFTVGFSRYSDRQWAVWSEQDLSAPLTIENIDSSSGVLFPFYDHDTRMVYVAGKGDGNIRYYETTDEHPYCHYLSQFLSGFPQRSLGIMPKRGLDVHKCEVARFYKLHATKSICEPISFIVPRKSEQFQSDIFPDTAAPTPALTADQWLSGQNRNPVLFNLKTGAGAKTNKPIFMKDTLLSSNSTISSNSERKLEFISKLNPVDYREKEYLENDNKNQNSFNSQTIQNGMQHDQGSQNEEMKIGHSNQSFSSPKKSPRHFEVARNRFKLPQDDTKNNVIESKSESALAMNYRESISKATSNNSTRSKLPWIKDQVDDQINEEQSKPKCDIVSVKHLPQASFITINSNHNDHDSNNDEDSDDSANTTDDSIAEELAFSAINSHNYETNNSNESFNTSNTDTSNTSSNENDSPVGENSLDQAHSSIDDLIENQQLSNTPKNERELWCAFHEQRALIHNLQMQLKVKDKKIEELEKKIQFQNHLNHQSSTKQSKEFILK